MIRAARLLNLRRIRLQPLRAVLAVVAVAAGVALGVSILVVSNSLKHSYATFGRALAGPAQLRVVGAAARGGLDQGVLPAVQRTPGVAAAVPVVQAVTFVGGPDPSGNHRSRGATILALGVDCSVQAFTGPQGCSPEAIAGARDTDPPLLSSKLARFLGPQGIIRTDLGRLSLNGAATVDRLDTLNGGNVAVFPLPVAQHVFARPNRLDAIYIQPSPGTQVSELRPRLEKAVGGWNGVLTSTDPPPGATVVLNGFLPLFSMLSVFGIGIAVVLVYDTVALSVEERRRDLAVVAALGGTARTVIGGTIAEAAVLGMAGGILGALGSLVLARSILKTLSDFSVRFTGVPITVHGGATPFVVGLVLGIGLAVLAAWLPARRVMRMDVSAELSNREARDEAAPALRLRRALLYAGTGGIALVVCWLAQRDGALSKWQPPAGELAVGIASAAFIVASGAFAPLLIGLWRRRGGGRGAPSRLGLANLVREPGRTATMAAAVAAPVAVAFIIASFVSSIHHAVTDNVVQNSGSNVRVSTVPVNNSINIDSRLSPAVIEGLRHVPGVARVDRASALLAGHGRNDLIGVVGSENPDRLPFRVFRGTKDLGRFERGEVLVGANLAREENLRAGSRLRLPTPAGWQYVTVQGVWENGDFNGRAVSMPMSLLERLYGPQPAQEAFLHPAPGVSPDRLVDNVYKAQLDPALQAQTPTVLARLISRDIKGQFASFWAIQRALLLVAFVAVLATLLLVAVQRRRELALLAAVGMRPSELGRMVLLEAVVVGVVGTVLGAVFGVGMYLALQQVLPIVIGFHDPFRLDPSAIPTWGVVATVIVVVAATWPAWRTARVEVLENLQYE